MHRSAVCLRHFTWAADKHDVCHAGMADRVAKLLAGGSLEVMGLLSVSEAAAQQQQQRALGPGQGTASELGLEPDPGSEHGQDDDPQQAVPAAARRPRSLRQASQLYSRQAPSASLDAQSAWAGPDIAVTIVQQQAVPVKHPRSLQQAAHLQTHQAQLQCRAWACICTLSQVWTQRLSQSLTRSWGFDRLRSPWAVLSCGRLCQLPLGHIAPYCTSPSQLTWAAMTAGMRSTPVRQSTRHSAHGSRMRQLSNPAWASQHGKQLQEGVQACDLGLPSMCRQHWRTSGCQVCPCCLQV